jgi:hypothetical protein
VTFPTPFALNKVIGIPGPNGPAGPAGANGIGVAANAAVVPTPNAGQTAFYDTSSGAHVSTKDTTGRVRKLEYQSGIDATDPEYGALGDGVTDDAGAITNAVTASDGYWLTLPANASTFRQASTLLLPAVSNGGLHLGGGGTLKANGALSPMVQFHGNVKDVVFEDITFDGNAQALACLNTGFETYNSITIRRCKFQNFPSAQCLQISQGRNIRIEECTFDGGGLGVLQACSLSGSIDSVIFRGNVFRGCSAGLVFAASGSATGVHTIEDVLIEGNYFDGMYYTLPGITLSNNQTYSVTGSFTGGTSLVDPNVDFTNYANFGEVRAMVVKATGTTVSGTDRTQLFDSGAAFASAGILEGDVIRTTESIPRFAIVKGVCTDGTANAGNTINVEEWLSDVSREPIDAPANGTYYTVYSVRISKITSLTNSHSAAVYFYWSDMNGNVYDGGGGSGHEPVITANTRYEICPPVSYPIQCDTDVRRVKIIGNTFRRGWTDQVSSFGDECIIADNYILDGQDEGITINQSASGQGHHTAHDNYIYRQGSSGVACTGDYSIVHDNHIKGWGMRDGGLAPGLYVGGIGTLVHHNLCDGSPSLLAADGIWHESSSGGETKDNKVINNAGQDIVLNNDGGSVSNGVIQHDGKAPAYVNNGGGLANGVFSRLRGSGSPANSVTAGIGSTYFDYANGIGYIKNSGTGNSGWIQIGSTTTDFTGASPILFQPSAANTALSVDTQGALIGRSDSGQQPIRLAPTVGGETGSAALYAGASAVSPNASNYTFAFGPSFTFFNSGGEFFLGCGSTSYTYTSAGFQLFSESPSLGNGQYVVGMAYAGAAPNANPSGGIIFWADSNNGLLIRMANGVITSMAPLGSGTVNTQLRSYYKYEGVVTTTNTAAATAIISIPIASGSVGAGVVKVTGRCIIASVGPTEGDQFFFTGSFSASNLSGTVTLAAGGTPLTGTNFTASMSTCAVTFAVSGANVLVKVAGIATATIDWSAVCDEQNT